MIHIESITNFAVSGKYDYSLQIEAYYEDVLWIMIYGFVGLWSMYLIDLIQKQFVVRSNESGTKDDWSLHI